MYEKNNNVLNRGMPGNKRNETTRQSKEEILEIVKRAFPWHRIEPRSDISYRYDFDDFHPQYQQMGAYREGNAGYASFIDPRLPIEAIRQTRDDINAFQISEFHRRNQEHPEWEEWGYWEEYKDIPGFREEPDAPPIRILVRRFRDSFKKGPHPVLFIAPAAGIYFNNPESSASAPAAKFLECQLVIPSWRSYADAEYPAGVNDFHAAYQWMIDNAEILNIDTDRIIIAGASGGGLLAASLSFRLKRYNWCGAPMPRCIAVQDGVWDDIEKFRSQKVLGLASYSVYVRGALKRYLGENFASGFIGPEAIPNRATAEECKGLPPFHINSAQDFWGCDPAMEFILKLNQAGIYCDFYMQGAATHGGPVREDGIIYDPLTNMFDISEYAPREGVDGAAVYEHFLFSIKQYFEYDFRRYPYNK